MTWNPMRQNYDRHHDGPRCDRCGTTDVVALTGSYFNTEMICLACSDTERAHPDFERARRAENAAVLRGDYNYPGVGKPADL